jgi:hypothetical protein
MSEQTFFQKVWMWIFCCMPLYSFLTVLCTVAWWQHGEHTPLSWLIMEARIPVAVVEVPVSMTADALYWVDQLLLEILGH